MTAITYRTKDNSYPAITIQNPIMDDAEIKRLRDIHSTIYNPTNQTMIVTL